jgi:hypothetical protein
MSKDLLEFSAADTNLNRYVGNRTTATVDPSGLVSLAITTDVARAYKNMIVEKARAKDSRAVEISFQSAGALKQLNEKMGGVTPVRPPSAADVKGYRRGTQLPCFSLKQALQNIKAMGRPVAALEFCGHAQGMEGITVGEELGNGYFSPKNVAEFAQALATNVSFTNPAVIILASCNLGNFTKKDSIEGRPYGISIPQTVANMTGLPVLSPGGYSHSLLTTSGLVTKMYPKDNTTFYQNYPGGNGALADGRAARVGFGPSEIKNLKAHYEDFAYESADDVWYVTFPDAWGMSPPADYAFEFD